jgi:hypothetical protein
MVLVSSFERRARFASVGHEKQSKRRNLEPAASTVGVVSWFGVNKRGKPRAVIVFSHRKCLSTRFAKVNSLIDSLIYPLLLLIQMFVREVTFAKRRPFCRLIHRGKLATARQRESLAAPDAFAGAAAVRCDVAAPGITGQSS